MKKELIDTHCHLYLNEFGSDVNEVMARAEAEGITTIFMPSIDTNHLDSMLELQKVFKGRCYPMLGLHPCYVRENYRDELDIMKNIIETDQFSAIGEIGLDYYWARNYDEQQMICFTEQIDLAVKHGLPIVIHSRNSMDACIQVLKEKKSSRVRGIFHCFSGDLQNAIDIIDCGFLLGIGGVITYKNSGLAAVVAQVPLEHLVLETDAPYLTPVPFRGKRNESSYLKYIVAKIAEVKNISEDLVAGVTTLNAKKVFNMK
ncbi:MAG TPA: TatD family hydrolase [Flavitalea sp.]|nr:TatD family hydrolase [Flavitalea sp.]